MTDRRFLLLLAGTRRNGNSEALAVRAAEALPDSHAREWIRLDDHPLPAFADVRHEGSGAYPEPEGHARTLWEATRAATDVVIVSPLYWYSVSTSAKLYLDHWSGWMRVPGSDFRGEMNGKSLWGVTSHAGPADLAEPLVGALRNTAAFMGMAFGGVLLGNATRPGRLAADPEAMAQADRFFGSASPAGVAAGR